MKVCFSRWWSFALWVLRCCVASAMLETFCVCGVEGGVRIGTRRRGVEGRGRTKDEKLWGLEGSEGSSNHWRWMDRSGSE